MTLQHQSETFYLSFHSNIIFFLEKFGGHCVKLSTIISDELWELTFRRKLTPAKKREFLNVQLNVNCSQWKLVLFSSLQILLKSLKCQTGWRNSLLVVDPRARVLPWLSVLELEPKLGPLRGSFDLQIFRVKEQLEQIVGSDWSEKCCQSFVSRYVSFAVTHGILVMRVGIFASLWVGCGFDPNSRQLQLSLIMT